MKPESTPEGLAQSLWSRLDDAAKRRWLLHLAWAYRHGSWRK